MKKKIKAIETEFDGIRFRSRLEARWAVYFKGIGFRYEYEPEGFDLGGCWYIPDFWLPDVNAWAEVKPARFAYDDVIKCCWLARGLSQKVVMLDGAPSAKIYWEIQPTGGLGFVVCDAIVQNIIEDGGRFFYQEWVGHEFFNEHDLASDYLEGDLAAFEIGCGVWTPEASAALIAARRFRFEHREEA